MTTLKIVSDQVSHPYKTTNKIIVLYILIFKFLDSKVEELIFKQNKFTIFRVITFMQQNYVYAHNVNVLYSSSC